MKVEQNDEDKVLSSINQSRKHCTAIVEVGNSVVPDMAAIEKITSIEHHHDMNLGKDHVTVSNQNLQLAQRVAFLRG